MGLADIGLAALAPLLRARFGARGPGVPRSILLLRLERVGDLLMTLDAISAVRTRSPRATIDLVVGSWNEALARLIPGVNRVETLNVPWLARDSGGASIREMTRRAWGWRQRRYDLAINFEGDVRSQVLIGLSAATRRVGFDMAGGGPMLTDRVRFDPSLHVRANAMRLVDRAFDPTRLPPDETGRRDDGPRLRIPGETSQRAAALLPDRADRRGPTVVVHAGGGREVKQWDLERFSDVANRLAASHGAVIVLSGNAGDRPVADVVKAGLGPDVECVDLVGTVDLVTLAAVLERSDLLITGDTGPMHLAAALDVPVVAVFGPSDPARWGPWSPRARVVRAQLPCSPCNRIRRPPERCRGHVPDCLAAVGADAVYDAAVRALSRAAG